MRRLLDRTDARLLLVPHVFSSVDHPEHDPDACNAVAAELNQPDRISILPEGLDAAETKWVIGRTNWFCATRMHAAIAALSQAVSAAAVAYSRKTRGVFETCDQVGTVADARLLNTDDVVDHLWGSWEARADAEETLTRALPHVQWQANMQMDEIVANCSSSNIDDEAYRIAA